MDPKEDLRKALLLKKTKENPGFIKILQHMNIGNHKSLFKIQDVKIARKGEDVCP